MKSSLVFALLALVAVLGVVAGLLLAEPWAAPGPGAPAGALPSPGASPGDSPAGAELRAELARLARRVDELAMEIAALRSGGERRPAPAAGTDAQPAPPAAGGAVDLDALEAALAAIDARREEERLRALEERELVQILERAERLSAEVAAGPAGEKRIADLLVEEKRRRDELLARAREASESGSAEEARRIMSTGFAQLRNWRALELGQSFPPEAAARLHELMEGGSPRSTRR